MKEEYAGIYNNCVAYGTGVIKSEDARQLFESFNTGFLEEPKFTLILLSQAIITNPELIGWLKENGYMAYASVLEEHSKLSMQGPPDFTRLCTELNIAMNDSEDIIGNILLASSYSTFFNDLVQLATPYLNNVMKKTILDLLTLFKDELRFFMLLYSALWNCDFEGFREFALRKLA